jgi:hypothetical protein
MMEGCSGANSINSFQSSLSVNSDNLIFPFSILVRSFDMRYSCALYIAPSWSPESMDAMEFVGQQQVYSSAI